MLFPLLRQSAGVMEWWSNGVMKEPIQVEIRAFVFANTPILQYSNTPVLENSSQSLPAKLCNSDLALKTRFSMITILPSLTFLTGSGYSATPGPIIAHLDNQMGRTSFFWVFAERGYRNGKHRVGRHIGNS
jgi:hypothetical protein